MSAKTNPQRCAAILRTWRDYVPPSTAFDGNALSRIVAEAMIPPWKGAGALIKALADERGVTLDIDPQALSLDPKRPSRLAQDYPLFATLRLALQRSQGNPPEATRERARRQILMGLFGQFDGEELGIYYGQFLEIRGCLEHLGSQMPDPRANWRSTAWAAHAALQAQLANAITAPTEVSEHLENFAQLLDGRRGVGERLRGGGGGGGHSGGRTATERLDDSALRDPDLGKRIDTQSVNPRASAAQPAPADPVLATPGSHTVGMTLGGIKAKARAATSDSEAALTIELGSETTLPPKDAARVARQVADRAPESATPSPADTASLPLGRVRDALQVLAAEPVDFLYTWLVLTTSIDAKRLAMMRKSTARPADEAPHFDGEILAYRLINGPSAGDDDDSHRMVEIALPKRIAHYLRTWGEAMPFVNRREPINNRLAYELGNTPGPTPTLDRLRETGAHFLADRAVERTQAQMLSGGFNFGYIVPGTYRRVAASVLQALFATHHKALASELLAISPAGNGLRPWLDDLRIRHDITRPPTGSARALAPEGYQPVFKALRSARVTAEKAMIREPKGSAAEAKGQVEALRLLAAETYLAYQLGTGARPIAERATATRADKGPQSVQHAVLYIRDKDSHAYREARVLPLANDLAKALDALDEAVDECATRLNQAGWRTTEARPAHRQTLPARIDPRPGQEAVIRVFRNADFARVLTDYAIPDPRPEWNATRHTVGTALTKTLDEPQVNAVMGHAGAGGTYFHPEALASLPMGAVKAALGDVLRRAGFRYP